MSVRSSQPNLSAHGVNRAYDGELSEQFTLVIRPRSGWVPLHLAELWEYRELFYFLTWRDIKVRYKQTLLGVLWAILQPLLITGVFSIFFGRLGKIPSDGIPYPIFTFCALLPWQLFANALIASSNSLVANERLITKVFFPRLVIPLSSVLSGVVDFFCAFLVLCVLMVYYGMVPTSAVWTLPLFVALAVCTALSAGLWFSALNVEYRDVRYLVPFISQFWLFISPVAYPSSLVPEAWRFIYGLNPMSGVIEGFRWALLPHAPAPGQMLAVSGAVTVLLFVSGLYYFRRMEAGFADLV